MIYQIVDAIPDQQHDIYEPLRLWLGRWQEKLVGIMTDPPGSKSPEQVLSRQGILLHHTGTIQKCIIDDRMPAITGLATGDVKQVGIEVAGLAYGVGAVTVDGIEVTVDTLTYRGLDFAFGQDATHPFGLLRASAAEPRWPQLVTRPADH